MRVLIHTDEYCPTAQACSNRMRSFVDAITAQGDEVTVICSAANLDNGDPCSGPGKIIYAPAYRMKRKSAFTRLLNNMSFAISSLLYAIWAGKADVVITTSPPVLISIAGWMIARLKGAFLVYDVRDIWPDVALEMGAFSEKSFLCRLFRWITGFMYRHADLITTVSPGKLQKIRNIMKNQYGSSGRRDKVVLVSNGFDESVASYPICQDLVEQYDLDDPYSCVYIGNIGLAQGLDALLNIAEKTEHKDARFLLFGQGADKERLQQLVKERNLTNVSFCGVLPKEYVNTVLSHATLSFIPLKSSRMKDSVPTKLYESLGIGCPVLLMAEGDSCRILEKTGFGKSVSPDQREFLAAAFDEMLDHYDGIIDKKDTARKYIHDHMTRQQIGADFAMMLHKIIPA